MKIRWILAALLCMALLPTVAAAYKEGYGE